MSAYRYHRSRTVAYTKDNKLELTADPLQLEESEIAVLRGDALVHDEKMCLFGWSNSIVIPKRERMHFLRSAQQLMNSEGYNLDIRCDVYIEWITDDHQWLLYEIIRGCGWYIRSNRAVNPLPVHGSRFRTRDAAVDWAKTENATIQQCLPFGEREIDACML